MLKYFSMSFKGSLIAVLLALLCPTLLSFILEVDADAVAFVPTLAACSSTWDRSFPLD